ncbi:hypothetical protein [Desulfolucanica intricata]|uniref:hypothetical protein n=1 Tax=Desulfolucanica intricata TaxID=1285191 RepID=UPI000B201BEE|nr:hypothetical protein [Desulfolucanica intricata]
MLSPKVRLILMILGPLFILVALSKIFSPIVSSYLFALGVGQVFLLMFKGGG